MESPRKIKTKQYIIVISCMITGFVLVHLFSHWLKKDLPKELVHSIKRVHLPNSANTDLQSLWVQKLESKNKEQANQLNAVTQKLEQQDKDLNQLKEEFTQNLKNLAEKLEKETTSAPKSLETFVDPFQVKQDLSSSAALDNFSTLQTQNNANASLMPIVSHHFKLSPKKVRHTKDNYIPAGSFVEAVVLGGVDASAGVTAQSDPRPVLLRLVDLSVLPNRFRKDVKDCHVVGAGFGDISSERAYIRTERLSCVLQNDEVFEQPIEAYAAGEDGKDGLRGTVVRREGDLIFNSFLAGTIAGIGKGMSQSFGTTSTSPLGSTKTLAGQDILKSGLYGGAGEGADHLQKYFIERAEQMQPVIQISAGRTVTLIFLKGVELDAT